MGLGLHNLHYFFVVQYTVEFKQMVDVNASLTRINSSFCCSKYLLFHLLVNSEP